MFGRVNEGKMTLAGHNIVPGQRPAGICTHRTGAIRNLFKIYIVRFQRCPSGHRTVPGWASYGARLSIVQCLTSAGNFQNIFTNWLMPVQAPDNRTTLYGARPGSGQCFYIQTLDGARTICDQARKILKNRALAIIKFGDVHIAEIVRCQFYLWP